jgi:hypothetical protein
VPAPYDKHLAFAQSILRVKKPRAAGLFLWPVDLVRLAQVFVDGLMQMPDPALLIAGENDLAGR